MDIIGIGWVKTGAHGTEFLNIRGAHADLRDLYRKLRAEKIIPAAIASFGRCDLDSKRVCLAVALALHDAGISPGSERAFNTGLLITSPEGARAANLAYFRDYLVNGRVLGRGNLFIYTLPSSPAAETAIGFRLGGPLLYAGREGGDSRAALIDAADFVAAGQSETMLCAVSGREQTICWAIRAQAPPDRPGRPLEEFLQADRETATPRRQAEFPGGDLEAL